MELSIIVLSYSTKDLTIRCIKSIAKQYQKELEKKEFEIIVIDNNSTDDSVSAISGLALKNSTLKLILNKENLGFAKGCNIGTKSAQGKYLLFLNSDTEVLDRGFISMTEFLDKNPRVGILGGRLENTDGSSQPSAGKFYNLGNLTIMLLGLERFGFLRSSPNKIAKVDWVSGACMMTRSDILGKLSGFDENFFMYIEDMEICYRTQKLGFLTYFYPNIKLRHKSLGSSNRTFAIINICKGILYFYAKHRTRFEYNLAKALLLAKAGISIAIGLITFNTALIKRYWDTLKL